MGQINLQASLSAVVGILNLVPGSFSKTLDLTGVKGIANTQVVGTAWEAVQQGDIGTIGFCLLVNADPTNFVEVALDSGGTNKFAKLLPGEFMLWPPNLTALYLKADTAACSVLAAACER